MWASRFVGAHAVGPRLGEQKPLGKTPLGGNPSPEMTYVPTCIVPKCFSQSLYPEVLATSFLYSVSYRAHSGAIVAVFVSGLSMHKTAAGTRH